MFLRIFFAIFALFGQVLPAPQTTSIRSQQIQARMTNTGPRYQVLKEYVLSNKRQIRYEAQPIRQYKKKLKGNVVAEAEFIPGFSDPNSNATDQDCTDMDGRRQKNGAQYERPNGHFVYKCNNGLEEVAACLGTERTGRARIAVGKTLRIDGYWHKCEKYANGSVIYTQETSCTSGSKDYRVGEEILVGNLRMVCGDQGYSASGCYFYDGNLLLKMNPGEQRQVGQVTHYCEEKGSDSLQYYTRGAGQCAKAGREFEEGESFRDNHIQYKCQNGGMDVIGCFIDESHELAIGQDMVEKNRVHRCYRIGVNVEYTTYACGYHGGPSCKPPPIPRGPDDEIGVAKGMFARMAYGSGGREAEGTEEEAEERQSKAELDKPSLGPVLHK